MSCAKSNSGPEYAQYIDYINNRRLLRNSTMNPYTMNPSSINCRKGFLPSFTPVLSGLSVTSSVNKTYSLVYVYGSNFLPGGTTFIKFGDFGYLPATYYSSFTLSFQVPLQVFVGNYDVRVVNLYNGNFSTPVNQSYPGNLNYSTNSITYSVT